MSNMFNLFRLCLKDEISFDIVAETGNMFPKTATMSKQHSTLSKERNFTIESFDVVAVCGWLVGWSLTALSTQCRPYRAFKVRLY